MLTGGLSVISAAGAGQLQPGDFAEFTKTAFSRVSKTRAEIDLAHLTKGLISPRAFVLER